LWFGFQGHAIGKCPKDKLFRAYIDLELQLREFDRCRILYEKFVEFNSENCTTWIKVVRETCSLLLCQARFALEQFAELETLLGDVDRARAIYELAIEQPSLDMPEVLWKAYIDFEASQVENDNARRLYQRLLKRTQHVKVPVGWCVRACERRDRPLWQVWISYAKFEAASGEESSADMARRVYRLANKALRSSDVKEERILLLEAWKEFEVRVRRGAARLSGLPLQQERGDDASRLEVENEMPKRVKKRRKIQTEDQVRSLGCWVERPRQLVRVGGGRLGGVLRLHLPGRRGVAGQPEAAQHGQELEGQAGGR